MGSKSLLSQKNSLLTPFGVLWTHRFVQSSQTVVTDGDLQSSTYLATPSSEKSLAYYSNEKEEEGMGGQSIESEGGITPIRSAHFAVDLERR